MIDYTFAELKLRRIEAEIDSRNQASAKILERLGFLREGHLRDRWMVSGEVSDSNLYGLLVGDRDLLSSTQGDQQYSRDDAKPPRSTFYANLFGRERTLIA